MPNNKPTQKPGWGVMNWAYFRRPSFTHFLILSFSKVQVKTENGHESALELSPGLICGASEAMFRARSDRGGLGPGHGSADPEKSGLFGIGVTNFLIAKVCPA